VRLPKIASCRAGCEMTRKVVNGDEMVKVSRDRERLPAEIPPHQGNWD
jgi:hypothetical protein